MPDRAPTVPPPLRVRPVRTGDLEGITELYVRANLADLGEADTDADDVESIWRWPGFDLERDAVLVVDTADVPAAYAWVHEGAAADLLVDPAWRRRGTGRALLDWLVARAAEQAASAGAATSVQLEALSGDQATGKMLRLAGFRRTRMTLLMGIDLTDGAVRAPAWPDGVARRDFDPARDARAVHALVQEAFQDVEGTTRRPYEQWATFTVERRGFDPSLCVLVAAGDELVGVALNHRFEGDGFVQYLAVARAWRRRGLGEALLRASFAHMATLGMPRATLFVDAGNSTGATRLYERAGMRPRHRWDRWELTVGA